MMILSNFFPSWEESTLQTVLDYMHDCSNKSIADMDPLGAADVKIVKRSLGPELLALSAENATPHLIARRAALEVNTYSVTLLLV